MRLNAARSSNREASHAVASLNVMKVPAESRRHRVGKTPADFARLSTSIDLCAALGGGQQLHVIVHPLLQSRPCTRHCLMKAPSGLAAPMCRNRLCSAGRSSPQGAARKGGMRPSSPTPPSCTFAWREIEGLTLPLSPSAAHYGVRSSMIQVAFLSVLAIMQRRVSNSSTSSSRTSLRLSIASLYSPADTMSC
jgi:hypothetical protein